MDNSSSTLALHFPLHACMVHALRVASSMQFSHFGVRHIHMVAPIPKLHVFFLQVLKRAM